ncbi:DUF5656 family protein [Caldilinea sp.]|jgi:hypothetical protein|uniref:DUF5656 family protein n=1 Tax=Caldilinea sp. TaxID=2293560 RepID=UPI0021DF1E46|nr:hypothetical protein [Caldilinea sp.]GIV68523.1 MAG: hypothetical protein KatS3mg048_1385 [Caldilinea sp.]
MQINRWSIWREGLWERWRWRPRADLSGLDYRDRISVTTWVLVFGFGLSLIVEIPSIVIRFRAFGTPAEIELTSTTIMGIFLAIAASAGAESLIRLHPKRQANRLGLTWAYWALPAAMSIITVVLLPSLPTRLLQILVILAAGVLLTIAFFSLYATVEPGQPGFRRARLWLDALAYGVALLLFLFVYQARTRSLLSGTLIALTATLLAVELLRTSSDETRRVLIYSAVVGLLLGEMTWALNYWPLLPGLTGGLLLLLSFYLAIGIALQSLQGRLTKRVLVEFGVFAVIAVILIVLFGPGF